MIDFALLQPFIQALIVVGITVVLSIFIWRFLS